MSALLELAARVEGLDRSDNSIDVLCEIALFEPGAGLVAVRSNAAGTKVIYTTVTGSSQTHWADDYTDSRRREHTAAALRAKAVGEGV